MTQELQEISRSELLEMFDDSPKLRTLLGVADAIVVFENCNFDSFRFGERVALPVGPGFTLGRVEDAEGRWINDLPSQRMYARYVYYNREPRSEVGQIQVKIAPDVDTQNPRTAWERGAH